MGILVISELADKWGLNEASAPDGSWTAKFPAFGFKSIGEIIPNFIKRDRNHPLFFGVWAMKF